MSQDSLVYRGKDAVILTNLGSERNDIFILARVQSLVIEIISPVDPFHQVGNKYAVAYEEGGATIEGTMRKAAFDGTLAKYAIGSENQLDRRDINEELQVSTLEVEFAKRMPEFEIQAIVRKQKGLADDTPNPALYAILKGCKITRWRITINANEFILEEAPFVAREFTIGQSLPSQLSIKGIQPT